MKRKSERDLMDVDELAEYLGLRKQTIYNWLHKRKISGIKIGKVWRFERDEIQNWLREHRVKKI
ncbi:MAG: helix-turn-helix domain-containing protein [Candidatus Omnitrophica bacterium]|nr:helix-turn-helix domain-containing protein [Candidatus Omnitrophota bacterium]